MATRDQSGRILMGKLTDDQRKVIVLLSDPVNFVLTQDQMTELLEANGLDRRRFVRAKRSKVFQDALYELAMRRFGEALPAVLQTALISAMIPGKDGFPDRQMVLKMAGVINNPAILRRLMGLASSDEEETGTAADQLAKATTRRAKIEGDAQGVTFDGEYSEVGEEDLPDATWDEEAEPMEPVDG